jgi:hypothetical protein
MPPPGVTLLFAKECKRSFADLSVHLQQSAYPFGGPAIFFSNRCVRFFGTALSRWMCPAKCEERESFALFWRAICQSGLFAREKKQQMANCTQRWSLVYL